MRTVICGFFVFLITVSCLPMAFSAPSSTEFYVQVLATDNEGEAVESANLWSLSETDIETTIILAQHDSKRLPFKVVLGPLETRAEAELKKAELKERGIRSLIRSKSEYQPERLWSSLSLNTTEPLYFENAPFVPTALIPLEERSPALALRRNEILDMPSTSPETLAAIDDLLSSLPDSEPLKGQMIARRYVVAMKKLNAYTNLATDLTEAREQLLQVAEGRIAGTPSDRAMARRLVVRILHYRDRDKGTALRAYKQILSDAIAVGDDAVAAMIRMDMAACMIEIAIETGLNTSVVEPRVASLWSENFTLVNNYGTSTSETAIQVRWTTCRIELMLVERRIARHDWTSAMQLNQATIDNYGEYPECQDELAEAWCHRAHIAVATNNPEMCYAAVEQALIAAAKEKGSIWGDVKRDPVYKAYAWKYAALKQFNGTELQLQQVKSEMLSLFPNHPNITAFFASYEGPHE